MDRPPHKLEHVFNEAVDAFVGFFEERVSYKAGLVALTVGAALMWVALIWWRTSF